VTLQIYVMDATKRREILEQRIKRAEDALQARQDEFWAGQDEATQPLRRQVKSMMVRESYPAEEILKTVKRENCDLIVMGGHEKGLSHTFLGGVAKSVLRRSRVPTMIVPLPEEED
jgi:nucleotide-binding universal stress UspA family protein